MLYIIHGDNIAERRKAREAIGMPDIVINEDTLEPVSDINAYVNSQSLWESDHTIYIHNIIENKDHRDAIYDILDDIKNSNNVFVIEETKINSAVLNKISKHATKVYDCTHDEVVNNRGNNRVPEKSPFRLCDYIAARDKKNAWLELMNLYNTDIESEPLHGAVWWKLKTMLSVYESSRAYNNAKYNKEELEQLCYTWVNISLRAHNGECDFRNEMEKWILGLA